MARTARTIIPAKSTDARDKALACLNWPIGKWKGKTDRDYQAAAFYCDACWDWYQRLSADQLELAGYGLILSTRNPARRNDL